MTPSGVGPTVSGVPITSSMVRISTAAISEAAENAGNHQLHHVRQHHAEHAQARGPERHSNAPIRACASPP